MKPVQRVVWSEGLLMTPQHLQQSDLYHEALLGVRLAALSPETWGAIRIEVDAPSLAQGMLKLTRFVGVMPDGVFLDLQDSGAEMPASRSVLEAFPATRRALPVYLALPAERPGTDNFAANAASDTRYRQAAREVYDLGGPDQATVHFSERAPVLLVGDEARDGYVSMQILELVRGEGGSLVVSDPYIAPCCRVDSSAFLMAAMRRLLRAAATRQRGLAEGRRQRSGSEVEFRAEEVTSFLLLNTLNGFLPVLSHLVDSGSVSPRQLYLFLCQFTGQLATFAVDVDPTSFPRFAYEDLRGTFEELFARATALLQASVAQHFVAIPLESDSRGMYRAALKEERIVACDRFLLSVKTDMPEQQTAAQLPQLAKVASWTDVQHILSAAAPGAPLAATYRPPPEVPVKAGYLYFTLETGNAYWRNVMAERRIAVYLPPLFDPAQTEVTLIGVKGA
jgi:type VI secretion system protein ImpJ